MKAGRGGYPKASERQLIDFAFAVFPDAFDRRHLARVPFRTIHFDFKLGAAVASELVAGIEFGSEDVRRIKTGAIDGVPNSGHFGVIRSGGTLGGAGNDRPVSFADLPVAKRDGKTARV